MNKEQWLPVVGYEGFYSVSNKGNVRAEERVIQSANRFGPMHKHLKRKDVKQSNGRHGYKLVRFCKDGKAVTKTVSRIVLEAFKGPPIGNANEAMHLDHDVKNNALNNLEWGTRQTNEDQKTAAGRRNNWSKLSADDVEGIRALRETGVTLKQIGQKYNTHLSNVSLILKGTTWSK